MSIYLKESARRDLRSRWVGNHLGLQQDTAIEMDVYRLVQRWELGDDLNQDERMALAAMECYTQILEYAQNPSADIPREMEIEAKYHVLAGRILETANKNTPINTARRDELIGQCTFSAAHPQNHAG